MKKAVDNLNAVARHSYETLDVVGLVVCRQFEHHDIAALGLLGEKHSSLDRHRAEFEAQPVDREIERIFAVAV